MAKATLNMILNQPGSYQNITITSALLPSSVLPILKKLAKKYNCVKTTEHDFKLHGKTGNTVNWSKAMNWRKAMLLLRTKGKLRLTMSWLD